MSYVAAVDHLHSLGQELASAAVRRKFDLAHMRVLVAALGDPQQQFPAVLIAGTNGKGSTAAALASICAAAGLRTALYTSPHLTRVTERIRTADTVEGSAGATGAHALLEIPEEAFARLYFRVDEMAQRLVTDGKLPHAPSFFESLTALAFLYFAERGVEIAILEVGLGGRLDATNIVDPMLSVITDIALDHQEYLGETIGEIAREKAGILRRHGTAVMLPQDPEANRAIAEAAVRLGARVIEATAYLPGRSFATEVDEQTADTTLRPNHYEISLEGEHLRIRSPLAGEHQQRNLALAIAAAVELRNIKNRIISSNISYNVSNIEVICNSSSYNITNAAIEEGIAGIAWPGRLEFLPPNLLLDVAHNPAGARALRAAIATLPQQRPRTLIFSCLRDKDLTEMARTLFPLFDSGAGRPHDHIVFAPIENPRAASMDALLHTARVLNIRAHATHDANEALTLARRLTPAHGVIVATGSIYLVGAVREAVLEP
jgi:dihydrofolate synthase/folylpolyglutamate synthase